MYTHMGSYSREVTWDFTPVEGLFMLTMLTSDMQTYNISLLLTKHVVMAINLRNKSNAHAFVVNATQCIVFV